MTKFKQIREEALKKVEAAKVFSSKKSDKNQKDPAFSKKGQIATADSGELEYGINNKEPKNKVNVTEEATVKTGKYSWGTMKTVHHGKDFSIPLHPEHQKAIGKLKDEQEHKFKDETGHHWVARRKGDDIHFDTTGNGSMKTHVPMKHITEDLDEAKTPAQKRDFKNMMAGAMSRDEYNKKHSLGKYAEKSGKSKIDPTGVYHNMIKTVSEDIDSAFDSWKDKVKKANPEHADKMKFVSKADQKHHISAEHGDRSFGTFNMKTGESEHLGEEVINELQKSTLVSYIRKAAKSSAEAANTAGFKAGVKQPKYNTSDDTPTEVKRNKGIERATAKLGEAVTMTGSIDQDAIEKKLKKISEKHSCPMDTLQKALIKGKEHEKEHTDDMDVATKIALDHLKEDPYYYDKLAKVEKE